MMSKTRWMHQIKWTLVFFVSMYLSISFVMNDFSFYLKIMEWKSISRACLLLVFIGWEFITYGLGLDL